MFYVDKTMHMLWQRIKEHVSHIRDAVPESPIARPFNECGSCNLDTLRLIPEEKGEISIITFCVRKHAGSLILM